MNPQTLISMVDYTLLQNDNWKREIDVMTHFNNCVNYAQSLQQPPTIADFIPAVYESGVWRVLEKPKPQDFSDKHKHWVQKFREAESQYQIALNNVKFKDIIYNGGNDNKQIHFLKIRNIDILYSNGVLEMFGKEIKSYSDLTTLNLPLTERGMEDFKLNI